MMQVLNNEGGTMTPEQFVYWLQGFAEVNESGTLSAHQWKVIQDHLKEVFVKKTPHYPFPNTIPAVITPTLPDKPQFIC